MKKILSVLALLPFWAFAQNTKSALPVYQSTNQPVLQTRAVVVGISDYQDPGIPDLRFADRDAEAFANFLRSPGGGGLNTENLRVLINQTATAGQVISALTWLLEESKPGDQAIIYFSGHGDVEAKLLNQLGFLLLWDSPAHVYLAGALPVDMLRQLVTTLSIEMKTRVFVVVDACRAGKLAGNTVIGTQLTSSQLAQQFSQEQKILSCQPNEFSIEGEQWGGGRGVFSYHLCNGLYGLADGDHDGQVSLFEIGRYLEDRVPPEVAPLSQLPLTVGDKSGALFSVDGPTLAALEKQGTPPVSIARVEQRGMVHEVLAKTDTSVRFWYAGFERTLRGNLFFEPAEDCAEFFFQKLSATESIAALHPMLRRNYAAALMDDAQQVINKLLKTDPATISNVWANPIKFDHVPAQLHRAAELLGEQHYIYKNLKSKEFYFLEKKTRQENYPGLSLDSINALKLDLLRQGLAFDSTAAYLWESHFRILLSLPAFEHCINKALEYSPNWALAHYELGTWYENFNEPQNSVDHYEKCIALAPDFLNAYIWVATELESQGETVRANKYRNFYVAKVLEKLANDSATVSTLELNGMANVLWRLRRYRESVFFSKKVADLTNWRFGFGNLLAALADQGKFEEYLAAFEKCHAEKYSSFISFNGELYFYYLRDTVRAEYWFEKAAKASFKYESAHQLLTNNSIARFYRLTGRPKKALEVLYSVESGQTGFLFAKGETLLANGREREARLMFDSLIVYAKVVFGKNDGGEIFAPDFVYQAIAFHRLGKKKDFQMLINQALKGADGWRHFWLAGVFAQTGEPKKALQYLELAEKNGWLPNFVQGISGTVKDPFLDPLRHLPEFQAWEKRWSPPYKDYSKN